MSIDRNDRGPGDEYGQFSALLQELDQHEQNAGATVASMGAASAGAAAASGGIGQICTFWPTLKTVLKVVLALPFIPGGVKNVVRQAITLFDGICAGGGGGNG